MPTSVKNKASMPNPALEPFRVLIGEWTTVGTHPGVPDTTLHGHTSFEWLEDGAFIQMRGEVKQKDFPDGIAILGSDDALGVFAMLYFDERGVSRKIQVTLQNNVMKWSHDAPDFAQRNTLSIVDDGDTIIGKGEMSKDGGKTWEGDLSLTYTRVK